MKYAEILDRLFHASFYGSKKWGLENSLQLDKELGHPSKQFPSVHIAGTNGKGSVALKMATAFQTKGLRVGLYTSPHIATFRERIRINGELIAEEEIEALFPRILEVVEREKIPATFFELTTMLGFCYFAQQKVDIAVLETGLGGRLDATNIVSPKLSVITSISFDHKEVLGDSLESIAREKAGIIKREIPVVIGPRVPIEVIEDVTKGQGSVVYRVKGGFETYDEENRAVARQALEVLGIEDECLVRPPCRIEEILYCGKVFVLDVAHNPDGLERLFQALRKQYCGKSFRVICGLSKNKDLKGCLEVIKKNAGCVTFVEAAHSRAAPVDMLAELWSGPELARNIGQAVEATVKGVQANEIIVVCGTFFIMQEVRRYLGIVDQSDPVCLQENYHLVP